MVRKLSTDALWGIGLVLFSAGALVLVLDQPTGITVRGAPGARFFPILLIGVLAILGALLLVGSLRETSPTEETNRVDRSHVRRVAIAGAGLIAYVYVMSNLRGWARSIGLFLPRGMVFAVTTALFLGLFMHALGERRLGFNVALTSGLTAALYLAFVSVLDVRFP